jgi:hypothetical protein
MVKPLILLWALDKISGCWRREASYVADGGAHNGAA